MFPPRTTVRSIVACALACGLLATTTTAAAARPVDTRGDVPTSSLAGTTTPRQDLRSPDARDAAREEVQDMRSPDARDAASAERIARSLERYYSTYGEPEPVKAPSPAVAPDEPPYVLISAIAAGLAVALASAALVLRHRRTAAA
jgi:hypothetical protein